MAFPPIQLTWVISPNNAVADASLLLMAANRMRLEADFLLANGYTCKGSSDGVIAAMDGVYRWAAIADAATRGANTTSAQSWVVLTDGNGVDILIANCGSSDGLARAGISLSGLYVAAGTATFTPTATDELLLTNTGTGGQDFVGPDSAAIPRVWCGWVDDTATSFRSNLTIEASNNQTRGFTWGVEEFDPYLQDFTVTPPTWGFCYNPTLGWQNNGSTTGLLGGFLQGQQGGRTRINGAAVDMSMLMYVFAGFAQTIWFNVQTELQGTVGYPIWAPYTLVSNTTGRRGPVGRVYDWWTCRWANNSTIARCGDSYGSLNYVAVNSSSGILWPWDGVTTPDFGDAPSIVQNGQHTGFESAGDPHFVSMMNAESQYVPNSNNNITPDEGAPPKSINRRAGTDVIRLNIRADDPPAETGRTILYSRLIDGVPTLFARYPDGTVYEVGSAASP